MVEEKSNVICLDKNKIKNFNFKNSYTVDFTNNLKLKKSFNYKPKYKLSKGLKEYFKWIKKVPVKRNLTSHHPLKE